MSDMLNNRIDKQSGDNDIIRITLLGGFSIESGVGRIADSTSRTHQLWHLIEYLVTFRHRNISQDELIEALWPNDDIENPSNALKNLIYRVRSAFSAKNLPHARDMIVFSRGCYYWNNSLNVYVDSEEFEKTYNQAAVPGQSVAESLRLYIDAIDLYKGDFLPGARYESWAVPVAGHYRSLYFKCVYAVLSILAGKCRYEEMETICRKALIIGQFEEDVHKYFIFALIKQDKQSEAMAHYNYVMDLFFRELGITPPASIRGLYRDIAKSSENPEISIDALKESLREPGVTEGAYYCDYEVFKNLYRIEARTALRTGQSLFICLLTVAGANNNILDVKALSKAMGILSEIVRTNLRKGDVFSRFSATQYVLLLPTLTYENCMMVMNRIIKIYKQIHRSKTVEITAESQPVNPVEILKEQYPE